MEDEWGAAVECREWTGQRRRSQFDGFGAAVGRERGADAHGQGRRRAESLSTESGVASAVRHIDCTFRVCDEHALDCFALIS